MVLYIQLEGDKEYYNPLTRKEFVEIAKDSIINNINRLSGLPQTEINLINELLFSVYQDVDILKIYKETLDATIQRIRKLKRYAKIFHLLKEGAYKFDTYNEIFNLNRENKKLIFFDIFLSRRSIDILCLAHNIVGFRQIIKNEKVEWEIITDINKYFNICLSLYENEKDDDKLNENKIVNYFNIIIDEIKHLYKKRETNHFRIRFLDELKNNYDKFISELQNNFTRLYIVRCNKDSYPLPSKKENLLILNLEKLGEKNKSDLLFEITNGDFKDQLVIIVDSGPEELVKYKKLYQNTVYPITTIPDLAPEGIYSKRIKSTKDEMIKTTKNFELLINSTTLEENFKRGLLNKIESFKKMGGQFNSEKINFWYALDLGPSEGNEKYIKQFNEYYHEYYFGDKSKNRFFFQFSHDKNLKVWLIKKNGNPLKPIKYSRSKGIKCIVYLYKHYKNKRITHSDLRIVLDEWQPPTSKTAEVISTDAKTISGFTDYVFDSQCPELSDLRECIKIGSNESDCYFRPLKNITIDVHDDDIPDPVT